MQSRVPNSEFIAALILMFAMIAGSIAIGVVTADPNAPGHNLFRSETYENCTRLWNDVRCD